MRCKRHGQRRERLPPCFCGHRRLVQREQRLQQQHPKRRLYGAQPCMVVLPSATGAAGAVTMPATAVAACAAVAAATATTGSLPQVLLCGLQLSSRRRVLSSPVAQPVGQEVQTVRQLRRRGAALPVARSG
eukprot:260208-Chlamydomonas_euryale.AAC.2